MGLVSIEYFLTEMFQRSRVMEGNCGRMGDARVWRMTGGGKGEDLLKNQVEVKYDQKSL